MRPVYQIVADIGGTNARFALTDLAAPRPSLHAVQNLPCGGYASLQHAAGPLAIEAYLDDPLGCRLIMSMKSYLASRSFQETRIFGRS